MRAGLMLVLSTVVVQSASAQTTRAAENDTILYSVVTSGKTISGVQKVWRDTKAIHYWYEYNDRGRGPALTQDVELEAGLPVLVSIKGNDYFKNTVDEKFSVASGTASWKSSAEHGSAAAGSRFFVSFNGAPGEMALLANALLKTPSKKLALLPAGESTIERAGERTLSSDGKSVRVTQYLVSGISFMPQPVWLDERGELFALGSTWQMTIRKGWESRIAELATAQDSIASARLAGLARSLRTRPAGPVLFRNARLFDSESGKILDSMSVLVSGKRITAVGRSRDVGAPANAQIIDVAGRTLMPGLWDMHVHTDDSDGPLHIAAGVTTVRDMANDTDELLKRRERFDAGTLIGPRILMAGIIDGVGPFAGPTKVLVETEEQARAAVDDYAKRGYIQIKVYSSVKPELVPAIVNEAHKHGLRVSGHVPAFMTAEQVVRMGFDEIQHANFLFLNFWGDSIKDTRTPLRFTAVADRAAGLDLSSQKVRDFVKLFKERGIVIDPTVNVFENLFVARPGQISPGYVGVEGRLPAVVRRGFLSGGLPVPEGKDSVYQAALPALLRMVKIMYDAGVPVVAGTDAIPGFALHRELELYSRAGIPNSEVLRIATIGAARVVKMDDSLGSIAKGKLADIIIVDGDPVKDISDVRRVTLTMKDGEIYDTAKVYAALGVLPFQVGRK